MNARIRRFMAVSPSCYRNAWEFKSPSNKEVKNKAS
jgi:hypothetical protein